MSTDIRRMSREDLERMNLEIARHKAARGGEPISHDNIMTSKPEEGTNTPPSKHVAEQLDLFS
jgi:hypothetical protein